MNLIKYFIQFLIITTFFIIFRILGLKIASYISSKILILIGPFFRSKRLIEKNILKAIPDLNNKNLKNIIQKMWSNYGRILSEYVFIKKFRRAKIEKYFEIEGQQILDQIKNSNEPVIFISGHFNHFELIAMHV